MGLVDYSDSDASDEESQLQSKPAASTSITSKQSFQKVVDRANPSKIKVNLPAVGTASVDQTAAEDERPAKRARVGGGGGMFSGLNSFLPAPKRSGTTQDTSQTTNGKKLGLGRGLGRGVSLRTGAVPAFSREAPSYNNTEGSGTNEETPNSTRPTNGQDAVVDKPQAETEVKLVGKATMFRPLSVARNKAKSKKPLFTASKPDRATTTRPMAAQEPDTQLEVPKKKVSLFSIGTSDTPEQTPTVREESAMEIDKIVADSDEDFAGYNDSHAQPYQASHHHQQQQEQPQTLNNIASELNLDAAAKRQLFGRRGRGDNAPINLVNFDTDQQYMANEELRAAGETVQHNALRTVQPGKHSLRQLVSSASTQKDALEESWAAGRRNKKEAGTKYGW